MINRELFSYESEDFETEEQPGQFVPFRKIKVRKEEDLAYLSFDIDPDLSFKMVKLANPSRRPPEELLAAAAKKLAAAFPLILFKENPEIYNYYIDRKFSAVSAEQFLKFSFTLTNVSRGSLKVTFFLHKDMGIDIESFFFLELDGEIFVTYFPEKKLLSEEEFYELSRFGSSYGRISATHQISWKTLNRRLSKISCRPQKAFFYSLGPKALMSPFAREVIKKDDPAENPFKFTAEKFSALKLEKQLELLEELDIHDVLVAARKKKSAGWKAVGSIGKWQ